MSTNLRPSTAAPTPLPPDLEPVPFIPRALPFDDPAWVFEPRYEGLRGLLVVSEAGCEIRGVRELHPERLGDLCERTAAILRPCAAVLDGAVVALDRDGKPGIRDLLRGRGFLAFAACDLLWLDGRDLRPLPLRERQRRLAELLPADTGPLYKVFSLEEHGRALFGAARRMELEGIVAKRQQDPYGSGTVWYSIRNPDYRPDDGRIDPFRARTRARRSDREPAQP